MSGSSGAGGADDQRAAGGLDADLLHTHTGAIAQLAETATGTSSTMHGPVQWTSVSRAHDCEL